MRRDEGAVPQPPAEDRPGDRWRCGLAEAGEPCARGPSRAGQCGHGDVLQSGRIPCVPRRTWAAKRRLLVISTLTLSTAALLALACGPWRAEAFAPGPLHQAHAQILGGADRSQRCAACHEGAAPSLDDWFASAGAAHRGAAQSQRCVECHHALVAPERATLAHGRTLRELRGDAAIVAANPRSSLSWLLGPAESLEAVACATCHREHQGAHADLSRMTDAQCQTCHQQPFHRFADDHPDWAPWPYGRGGRIAFDHRTHSQQHFRQADEPFDCRGCHTINAQGEIARSASYESSCAACHDPGLRVRAGEGLQLLALPTLDQEAIEQVAGVAFPDPWPPRGRGFFDGRIGPLTRLLLAADADAQAALARLPDSGYLEEIDPRDADQVAAAVSLATVLRELLDDLARDGRSAVVERLAGLADGGNAVDWGAVAGQFSPQVAQAARQQWFGTARQPSAANSAAETPMEPPLPFRAEVALPAGGWYHDAIRLEIGYRGAGHADPVLRAAVALAGDRRLDAALRRSLAELPAVAACIECHPGARDATEPRGWTAERFDARQRGPTRFAHRPHLSIPVLSDCQSCHQLARLAPAHEPASGGRATLPGGEAFLGDPVGGDFEPLERLRCAECHRPGAAGDGCTQCHRYHLDPPR